ncbi:hypothetical protein [Deinococcus hohokamensis]|uniref:Lipoprotein n=1 Tax=Deinococcus hohokamensis TaxID=309883 RepID=A0ABV9IAH1_9DEIO
MRFPRLPAFAALTVTALLLASCDPHRNSTTPPTTTDPAATAPAAPVAGQSTEMDRLPAALGASQQVVMTMLDPQSSDFDPDLKVLLGLVGGAQSLGPMGLGQGAQSVGRAVLGAFGVKVPVALRAQALTPVMETPLPTGTLTLTVSGEVTQSPEPTTGLVIDNRQTGVKLSVDWRQGGAQTVWLEQESAYGLSRTELPTRAAASMTRAGKLVAEVQQSMTPGSCLSTGGPDAVTLAGWAGRETNAPVAAHLAYAWGAGGVQTSGDVTYRTRSRTASAAFNLNVAGTTTGRCDPASFSFTPAQADLSAQLSVPGHEFQAKGYLRDLKNVVISHSELHSAQPFKSVSGRLNASLTHQGKAALTAFGELANGNANPLPGDQVKVQYVQNGQLVTTSLEALLMH